MWCIVTKKAHLILKKDRDMVAAPGNVIGATKDSSVILLIDNGAIYT